MPSDALAFYLTHRQAAVLRRLAADGPLPGPDGGMPPGERRTWLSLESAGLVAQQARGGAWWLTPRGQSAAAVLEPLNKPQAHVFRAGDCYVNGKLFSRDCGDS